VSLFTGSRFRRIQSGLVTNYAALMTLSLVLLLIVFVLAGEVMG
jgi:NADH-quinone oxidoreductase subunit L